MAEKNEQQQEEKAPRSGTKMPKGKGLDPGPRKGEKGEYLPARYKTRRGLIRRDN